MGKYIYLIVGESGSGKTSLANKMVELRGMTSIESYTTRPPRYEGEPGHIYVDGKGFNEIRNDLIAYTMFNGYEYGATKQQVDTHDFYVIDVAGIEYFYNTYHGDKIPIVVYVDASPFRRFIRMLKRGDSIKKALSRLEHDEKAFEDVYNYAHHRIVNNGKMKDAVANFSTFIEMMNEGFYEASDFPKRKDDYND